MLALMMGLVLGGAPDQLDRAAAEKGKVIYVRYCGSCHGPGGRGDGPIAPDLKLPPPDLTRLGERHQGRFPFEETISAVDGRRTTRAHGTPEMPVWGEVFAKTEGTDSPSVETAVARIVHYLWSIQAPAKK